MVSTQRIATCTREGRHPSIRLERYKEALADKRAGLTLPALTGERKQSVKDAERLFNGNLQEWFKLNGYHEEEKYMSQLLGTGIVQLMRGDYLSFKDAVSTMKC